MDGTSRVTNGCSPPLFRNRHKRSAALGSVPHKRSQNDCVAQKSMLAAAKPACNQQTHRTWNSGTITEGEARLTKRNINGWWRDGGG